MIVRKFDRNTDLDVWNNFLPQAKNSTFLFHRSFMDYHRDRFEDNSLMVYDNTGVLKALIPANINPERTMVFSHQGLTYGGIVYAKDTRLPQVAKITYFVLRFLKESKIRFLQIKSLPSFYTLSPSDEIEYLFFLLDARLQRRDTAIVLDRQYRIDYSGNIRREAAKAAKAGVTIKEEKNAFPFWEQILTPNLIAKFGKRPVHDLLEITRLMDLFPQNIKLFTTYLNGEINTGTLLFIEKNCIHCQYISSNDTGRKSGALNHLFCYLTDHLYPEKRFFDFGIVNENEGRGINSGLLFWKESFGGRAIKHDFHLIETEKYSQLEKFIQ